MKPDPATEGERWLEQARADLKAARHLMAGGYHNLACFQSQQAAEKALKGYLYFRGAHGVRGHAVGDLCLDCERLDPSFAELREAAVLLDKHYMPTRYPDLLPGGVPARAYDLTDAERATSLAERILAKVERLVGSAQAPGGSS